MNLESNTGGADHVLKHRFIVYQYGKVGSTSITSALNQLKGCEAHQTHFMGEKSFAGILRMLMDPMKSEYFFDHSSGQLIENLRLYRSFVRREIDPSPLTVVSIAREPFDWFRSALVQDALDLVGYFKKLLDNRSIAHEDDSEVLGKGLELVFTLLSQGILHFGTLDQMCRGKRYVELPKGVDHKGEEDFTAFMFIVNIFMRPYLWYHTQFSDLLGFGVTEMEPFSGGGLKRSESWGNTYVLNYESVQESMNAVMADLGFDGELKLARKNETQKKPFSNVILDAFASEEALRLRRLCHSEDTRLLGYTAYL